MVKERQMEHVDLLIKPVSGLCNMRCKYCFYNDVASCREVGSYGLMSGKTQENLVKKALSTATKACTFGFQGGEPTMIGLKFYVKQIELEKKYNKNRVHISNTIQTNGILMDEEWAKFLAENKFLVGLSLDGPEDINDALRIDNNGNGTYNRVMETVRLFDKYKVEYNILNVVTRPVAQNAKKVYKFYKDNNFRFLQFNECIDPFDNNQSEYSLQAEEYEKFLKAMFDEYYKDFIMNDYVSIRSFDNFVRMMYGERAESCGMCGRCSAYFLVEANGDVFPCDFYVLDRYLMGNLNSQSFDEIASSPNAKKFVDESVHVDEKCTTCEWQSLCHGGCRRYREPFVDGKPALNKFCTAFSNFFKYTHPRLKEMVKVLSKK